ncbi:uncharacterized protein [Spinacia oleracea]|uniref:Bifunctional inhibitor/plant lipid transfer protein/seed storage helical domain-containing protein n=1 Tax=Spinacia oleracea TaxID=3562 RepID=A0A9R0JZB6_SPIOL|nr:uncharacterized protein LOC110792185 [Spinacia oleracea]
MILQVHTNIHTYLEMSMESVSVNLVVLAMLFMLLSPTTADPVLGRKLEMPERYNIILEEAAAQTRVGVNKQLATPMAMANNLKCLDEYMVCGQWFQPDCCSGLYCECVQLTIPAHPYVMDSCGCSKN